MNHRQSESIFKVCNILALVCCLCLYRSHLQHEMSEAKRTRNPAFCRKLQKVSSVSLEVHYQDELDKATYYSTFIHCKNSDFLIG